MKWPSVIAIVFMTLAALYLAAASWVRVELENVAKQESSGAVKVPVEFEDIPYASAAARDRYILRRDATAYFPWVFNLPHAASLMVAAMSFGFIGGVIRLLHLIVSGSDLGHVYARLCLSALTGLVVLGVTYSLPAALTITDVNVRPVVLLFLCLLAGICARHLILWLQDQFGKAFERKS